jgi:hypothetical protein
VSEIVFTAAVFKVQNLIDGGIRVTLDLPEDAIPQAAMLLETRREGIPLLFTAIVDDPQKRDKAGDGSAKRRKG